MTHPEFVIFIQGQIVVVISKSRISGLFQKLVSQSLICDITVCFSGQFTFLNKNSQTITLALCLRVSTVTYKMFC